MTSEERDREGLSALMDGEAQELELRRMLEAVAGDTSLRERWQRQHRVRDALHGQLAGQADIDISKGVLQALETGKASESQPGLEYGRRGVSDACSSNGRSATSVAFDSWIARAGGE